MRKVEYGHYISSFYFIKINSSKNFDDIIKKDFSTFLHEYIHFLQDISLPYCIKNTLYVIASLNEIYLKNKKENKIECPINFINEAHELSEIIFENTWGGNNLCNDVGNINNHERLKTYVKKYDYNVYKHNVRFDDGNIPFRSKPSSRIYGFPN